MTDVATFTRLYAHGEGLEYPATPDTVRTVVAAMNEAVNDAVPFKVRLRLTDGTVLIVRPKGCR
jgi:hypothetical protein